VLPEDYFFLCSDGILEHIVDNQLIALMNSGLSDADKMNEIFKICQEKSKDNFSCCLVRIKSVEHNVQKPKDSSPIQQKGILTTHLQKNLILEKNETIVTAVQPRQKLSHKLLRLLMILALIGALLYTIKILNEY
jgi:hypothetical protein